MLELISSPVLRQYMVVIIANLCIVNLGMHIVWPSPMLIKFREEDQSILFRPPTESEEAWIVTVNQLFGVLVLFTTGSLLSRFGRRTLLLYTYVPRLAMCLTVIFTKEVWVVLLGRAIGGVADGIALSAVSTYVSEVAETHIRGASGTVTQIASATGMMLMFAVGPFASYMMVNLMMTSVVLASFLPTLLIPESPYFLCSKGRTQEAIEVLTLLRGTEELAHTEIKEYASSPNKDTVDTQSLLKDRTVIKTFILVILLSLVGYNSVNFYLQTIFEWAGAVSSEVSSLIVGVVQLVACCCTFFLTDKFGRKPILCMSLIGMFVGMIGLATFFVLSDNGKEITGFLNFLPLLSIMIIIYGFNAGVGSLLWMVVAELFEGPIRPYGVSCAILVSGSSGFLLTFFFPSLIKSIGPAIMYYFFAGGCVAMSVVIYYFVPETKGKSFAEIQAALGRKKLGNVEKEGVGKV